MDPSTDPNFPYDLITDQYLSDLTTVRVLSWAGYMILVYDFLLTFDSEVQLIWSSKWTFVKGLFLANRYGNIIILSIITSQTAGTLHSDAPAFCFAITIVLSVVCFFSYASIHVLVLLRAWAVWERQKVMFIVLVTSFLLYSAIVITILVLGIALGGISAYPTSSIVYTCVGYIPSWSWVLWMPSLLLEAATFGLTMYSLKKHGFVAAYDHSPIVRILVRDGIVYFLCTTFSNLFNVFVWIKYNEGPKNMLATTFAMCLTSVVGQRLVMDLRMIDGNSPSRINDCIPGAASNDSRPGSPIVFELETMPVTTMGSVREVVDAGGLKVVFSKSQTVGDGSGYTVIREDGSVEEDSGPIHNAISEYIV